MTPFGDDTPSIPPHMEDKVMSFIVNDATVETVVVMAFASPKLADDGLNFNWSIEEE
jgi:hypothetical protein